MTSVSPLVGKERELRNAIRWEFCLWYSTVNVNTRPPANLSSTHLQSSLEQRSARPAALIIGRPWSLVRRYYLLGNLMFSGTSLGLVVRISLSWYVVPAGGIRNLAICTSVSLSPPWEIRAYPSRTSPRYIIYSHQRSESVASMSCQSEKVRTKLRRQKNTSTIPCSSCCLFTLQLFAWCSLPKG